MIPSIFKYLSYRNFLEDAFSSLKNEKRNFSYRAFARLAGSTSPNYLQLITKRKLNISSTSIHRLSQNLGLSNREESFFENLVHFDHADTYEEKDKYYQRILHTKRYSSIKQLQKEQYEYFANWYNPVVRELIVHPDFNGDPAWIAQRIVPQVSTAKVKRSIRLLKSLKLIRFDKARNIWEQLNTAVSTPSEVASFAVAKFHESMIDIAKNSIQHYSSKQRDIRSVTLGLSKRGYQEIKKRTEAFWQEILDFASTQKVPESVFQLNMQLFPLVKMKKKDKNK
jgi:uncharacterized protein (TIGR02147 family)